MKTDIEDLPSFKERMVRARARLLHNEPFLGFMALGLPTYVLDNDNSQTPTAATDGRHYYFNYGWCRRLTDGELVFVIAHEVAHVMFLHMTRRGSRQPDLWNAACDFAVNGLLQTSCQKGGSLSGIAVMPWEIDPTSGGPQPIGLWEERFANWTSEAIYDELKGNATEPGSNWDQLLELPSGDGLADAAARARAAVAKSLVRAREHRQRQGDGNGPGAWERLAEEALQPMVRWQDRLRRHALAWGLETISWDRPNPKFRPHGFYLPRHRGYELPDILFAFDTSGSISDRFLGHVLAELNGLLAIVRHSLLRVVCCDAEVRVVGDFSSHRKLDPERHKFSGGGGTDFRPVFDYAQREKRFRQLIYFTDAVGTYPAAAPKNLTTLWLIPRGMPIQPPFGEVIVLPFSL